jgi:hypothetical protein
VDCKQLINQFGKALSPILGPKSPILLPIKSNSVSPKLQFLVRKDVQLAEKKSPYLSVKGFSPKYANLPTGNKKNNKNPTTNSNPAAIAQAKLVTPLQEIPFQETQQQQINNKNNDGGLTEKANKQDEMEEYLGETEHFIMQREQPGSLCEIMDEDDDIITPKATGTLEKVKENFSDNSPKGLNDTAITGCTTSSCSGSPLADLISDQSPNKLLLFEQKSYTSLTMEPSIEEMMNQAAKSISPTKSDDASSPTSADSTGNNDTSPVKEEAKQQEVSSSGPTPPVRQKRIFKRQVIKKSKFFEEHKSLKSSMVFDMEDDGSSSGSMQIVQSMPNFDEMMEKNPELGLGGIRRHIF